MKDKPFFQDLFGDDWSQLPRVLQRHYANRLNHDDIVSVTGHLNVTSSLIGRLLKPFFKYARILVPYEGEHIPTHVSFLTYRAEKALYFKRELIFPGKKPWSFNSKMIPVGGNEVIELMHFGLGWHMTYQWRDGKIVLDHKGYVLKAGSAFIPLPITWLIGKGYAEEQAISDDEFSMAMHIRHPLWGNIMGYNGRFTITADTTEEIVP